MIRTLIHRMRQTLEKTAMRIVKRILQLRELAMIILPLDVLLDSLDRPLDGLEPRVHPAQLFGRGHFPCQLVIASFGVGGMGGEMLEEVVDCVAHGHETAVEIGELGFGRFDGGGGRVVILSGCDGLLDLRGGVAAGFFPCVGGSG